MNGWDEHEIEHHAMLRIYSEYLEMPGLRLSVGHAQRLFGLGEQTCARLLDQLVAHRFLTRRPNGAYVRLTDGSAPLTARAATRGELEATA